MIVAVAGMNPDVDWRAKDSTRSAARFVTDTGTFVENAAGRATASPISPGMAEFNTNPISRQTPPPIISVIPGQRSISAGLGRWTTAISRQASTTNASEMNLPGPFAALTTRRSDSACSSTSARLASSDCPAQPLQQVELVIPPQIPAYVRYGVLDQGLQQRVCDCLQEGSCVTFHEMAP